jgi:mycofactocin precursor
MERLIPMDTTLAPQTAVDTTEQAPVEVEELLVEEVSIDGMCGVY